MNALVWTGARAMDLRDQAVPNPAPNEVLIEIGAVGICGSELSGYLGHNSLRKPPLIMGHEAAGKVVEVTQGFFADGSPARSGIRVAFNPLVSCGTCDRCRVGLENLCRTRKVIGAHLPGAFARYAAVPAALCSVLPDSLSLTAGSLIEPMACSLRAVHMTQAQPDKSLLILGAGPIGLFCVAIARAAGFKTIAVSDIADARLETARRWGASHLINATREDVVAAAHAIQSGGVDAVIDAVGMHITREQAVKAVIPGGRVVFIGLHEEASPLAANYIIRQEISVVGTFGYTNADFAGALKLLEQKEVQPAPDWLDERPLAAGRDSFEELINGTSQFAKIVLIPQ